MNTLKKTTLPWNECKRGRQEAYPTSAIAVPYIHCISSNKRPGAYFYRASKTQHLNETGRLFESRRLFLIAHFQGKVDLRRSLIAAHLRDR